MTIDYRTLANPKPEPRKRQQRRRKAAESAVLKSVRLEVEARDGYCLIASRMVRAVGAALGSCAGPSQLAHLEQHRRCFTRGQAPERRHQVNWLAMMCARHHADYDRHLFALVLPDDGIVAGQAIGIVRYAISSRSGR